MKIGPAGRAGDVASGGPDAQRAIGAGVIVGPRARMYGPTNITMAMVIAIMISVT
jgi:hypothetical protein